MKTFDYTVDIKTPDLKRERIHVSLPLGMMDDHGERVIRYAPLSRLDTEIQGRLTLHHFPNRVCVTTDLETRVYTENVPDTFTEDDWKAYWMRGVTDYLDAARERLARAQREPDEEALRRDYLHAAHASWYAEDLIRADEAYTKQNGEMT